MLCDKWGQLLEKMKFEFQSVWAQGLSGQGGHRTASVIVTGLNLSVSNDVPAQKEFLGTKHTTTKYSPHLCHWILQSPSQSSLHPCCAIELGLFWSSMISTLPILLDIKLPGLVNPPQFWLCSFGVSIYLTSGLPKAYPNPIPQLLIHSWSLKLCTKSKCMSPNSLALSLSCQLNAFPNTSSTWDFLGTQT